MVRNVRIMTVFWVAMLVFLALCEPARAVDGMVSCWTFDEGSGTTAYDSMGTNDGTIYGAIWATGIVDGALSFDGIDDYVEVPDSDSLDIAGAITMSGWVKANSLSGGSSVLIKGDYNGYYLQTSYVLHVGTGGEIVCVLYGYWPDDRFATTSSINTGEWYHLAATWDGTTSNADNVKIYIDGELNQSFTKTNTLRSVPQSVTIGSMKPPAYYTALDGYLDEVAIYDRALSPQEIEEYYQGVFRPEVVAIRKIEQAIAEKLEALETIDAALENEWAAYDALEELLASGDYGDLKKGDIVKAKQEVHVAIKAQELARRALEMSIEKLEEALAALGQ